MECGLWKIGAKILTVAAKERAQGWATRQEERGREFDNRPHSTQWWRLECSGLFSSVIMPEMLPEENNEQSADGNELPSSSLFEKPLPRWVLVPVGIALGLITLFCGFALLSLLLMRYRHSPAPLLLLAVALFLLLACGWILTKCLRLITGRKKRGGLLSPNTLRAVAWLMLILPIVALFTGYYREMGALAIFQAVAYFSGFLGLRALARKREGDSAVSNDRPKD